MINGCEKREKFVLEGGCPACTHEEVDVTVPVILRANACVKDVHLGCVGPAVVTKNCDKTPGCPGAESKFTIRQRMRVDIPIMFGAEAEIGEGHVEFESRPGDDCDKCKCRN